MKINVICTVAIHIIVSQWDNGRIAIHIIVSQWDNFRIYKWVFLYIVCQVFHNKIARTKRHRKREFNGRLWDGNQAIHWLPYSLKLVKFIKYKCITENNVLYTLKEHPRWSIVEPQYLHQDGLNSLSHNTEIIEQMPTLTVIGKQYLSQPITVVVTGNTNILEKMYWSKRMIWNVLNPRQISF